MNDLTKEDKAWLAGIYEGEGYCGITKGRAIYVQITMTDGDIVERIHEMAGIGTRRALPSRNPMYKVAYHWSVGGKSAVDFLTAILPWLGYRRSSRALEAIENWHTNRKQTSRGDTHCTHGHDLTLPNARVISKHGTTLCRECSNEAQRRYREKNRDTLRKKALEAYYTKKAQTSS